MATYIQHYHDGRPSETVNYAPTGSGKKISKAFRRLKNAKRIGDKQEIESARHLLKQAFAGNSASPKRKSRGKRLKPRADRPPYRAPKGSAGSPQRVSKLQDNAAECGSVKTSVIMRDPKDRPDGRTPRMRQLQLTLQPSDTRNRCARDPETADLRGEVDVTKRQRELYAPAIP